MSPSTSASARSKFTLLDFFFSSRRRHTRYIGDWSSDVCSSDLVRFRTDGRTLQPVTVNGNGTRGNNEDRHDILAIFRVEPDASGTLEWVPVYSRSKIGRASCRERV